MLPQPGLDAREATAALREGSAERLVAGFGRMVEAQSRGGAWDPRDAMISLVPFVDCARRLGLDPEATLGPVADRASARYGEVFRALVRRPDITLAAFGWSLNEMPEGPAYVFSWPAPDHGSPDGNRMA